MNVFCYKDALHIKWSLIVLEITIFDIMIIGQLKSVDRNTTYIFNISFNYIWNKIVSLCTHLLVMIVNFFLHCA